MKKLILILMASVVLLGCEDDNLNPSRNIGHTNATTRSESAMKPKEQIINGQIVPPGEYPWVVHLTTNGLVSGKSVRCTGSLLTPWYILTANHCVSTETSPALDPNGNIEILLNDQSKTSQTVSIKNAFFYPGMKKIDANTQTALDVALIKLDSPVYLSSYGRFNKNFTYPENSDSNIITVFGYGVNDYNGNIDNQLRLGKTTTFDSNLDSSPILMGGAIYEEACTFQGDSGGPANAAGGELVGVISAAPAEYSPPLPDQSCGTFIANIKITQNWLMEQLWPRQPKITSIDPKSKSKDNKTVTIDYTSSAGNYKLFYKWKADEDSWKNAKVTTISATNSSYTLDLDTEHVWAITLLDVDGSNSSDVGSDGKPLSGNASNYTWYVKANPDAKN